MLPKKFFRTLFLYLLFFSTISYPQIIADRNSVALFDQIPLQYKEAAANLKMLFMDRSVGLNIYEGLTCLSYTNSSAPSNCLRYNHTGVPSYSVDPSEVYWIDSWDCTNWKYEFTPDGCGGWNEKIPCFINSVEPRIDSFDVVGFQFSYLEVAGGSTIADPVFGFFSSGNNGTANQYIQFQNRHPSKTIIWATSSLARSIGTVESESFNNQMRQYAIDNKLVLLDVADILSHTPSGSPCYDNRDGLAYSFNTNSENYPDDGLNIPAICPEYTTEIDGGHLGAVSAGKIRVAKAFWVLMAQIAGWDPTATNIDESLNSELLQFSLEQNFPNPFNPTTKIVWTVKEFTPTLLKVYDVLGNEVATLVNENLNPGTYSIDFNASELPTGIYFYKLQSGSFVQTRKMLLMK